MKSVLESRLAHAETACVKSREGLKKEFGRRMAEATIMKAEFEAQWDFDHHWIGSIRAADKRGDCSADIRHVSDRRTDELYGWALKQLLTEKLRIEFVVEQRLPPWYTLKRPYVKIIWGNYREPPTFWQQVRSRWVLFRGQYIYGRVC